MSETPAARWKTWLQLLRAPNLFTVPGDPLAGFLLASGGLLHRNLAVAIGASLCFYCVGLLLNDLADLAEDRRDRPSRPLPSGAASVRSVSAVAILLAAVALLLCVMLNSIGLFFGLVFLATIASYNYWTKRIGILGPINMGLCRGLSVFLGAIAATATLQPLTTPAPEVADMPPIVSHESDGTTVLNFYAYAGRIEFPASHHLVLWAFLGVTIYIAAVTHLARIETLSDPPKLPRTLPFLALVWVIIPFFLLAFDRTHFLRNSNIWLYLISAYTLYAGFKIHKRLTHQPSPPIPPMIGQLIRLLLPLQAIFCVASRSVAGGIAAATLLALWPISRSVSRRFYAS
jgi:4-hydroxybenzoate polyprenyltransferase